MRGAIKLSTKNTKEHQAFFFSSCVFVPFVEKKEIPIHSSFDELSQTLERTGRPVILHAALD